MLLDTISIFFTMTQPSTFGFHQFSDAGVKSLLKPPFPRAQELVTTHFQHLTAEELRSDFSMEGLNEIQRFLWFVGRFGPCEPLHHHRVLLRTIIPCTSARLHLVWFYRTIYVTPMPECLLNASYYHDIVCQDVDLHRAIIGFLRSYCFLIRYPIDLVIAQQLFLIPRYVRWDQWIAFRDTVLSETASSSVNKRYEYGELRLHRLDSIYRLTGHGSTYFTTHRQYRACFAEYFGIFATTFAFVATILTAMQVIVAIEYSPRLLVSVCYSFSVMVLVGACLCFGFIGSVFSFMYLRNLAMKGFASQSRGKKMV